MRAARGFLFAMAVRAQCWRGSSLKVFGGPKDITDMIWDADFAPGLCHATLAVDQKCRPLDTHVLAPIHRFFDPDAIFFYDLALFVRTKTNAKFVLGAELLMAFDAVGRNADDGDPELAKVFRCGGEILSFLGAPGGVVLRVKINDDRGSAQRFQVQLGGIVQGDFEIRGHFVFFDHLGCLSFVVIPDTDRLNVPVEAGSQCFCPRRTR